MPNEPSLPTPQWDGPLVFPPTSTEHTHTIILLQGHTGTTASGLVSGRLESTFPSAKKRPTPAWSVRTFTRTWFDLYSLDDPSERDYTQIVGLEDTSRYLRSLIHAEATELLQSGIPCESEGYDRIIVGGFGQGFAASIFAVLGGDGVPAGYIGLNGWLPFERDIHETIWGTPASPSGHHTKELCLPTTPIPDPRADHDTYVSPPAQALDGIRQILQLEPFGLSIHRSSECLYFWGIGWTEGKAQ